MAPTRLMSYFTVPRKIRRVAIITCIILICVYTVNMLQCYDLGLTGSIGKSYKRYFTGTWANMYSTRKLKLLALNMVEDDSSHKPVAISKSAYNDDTQQNRSEDSFKGTHFMTIRKWHGQIGNKMFQYATLVATASRYGYTACVSPSAALLDSFSLKGVVVLNDTYLYTHAVDFNEISCCAYNEGIEHLDTNRNYSLLGYLQSWRYFQHEAELVRDIFEINHIYTTMASAFLSNVSQPGRDNVCVHVRVFADMFIPKGYAVADASYIDKAMDYMRTKLRRVQFIVLSNKKSYVGNITGSDVIYTPFGRSNPMTDLALLTLCDHVILTSGSFGWWGAWLAGGMAVYWRGFPALGSSLYNKTNMADYYPPNWIGFDYMWRPKL